MTLRSKINGLQLHSTADMNHAMSFFATGEESRNTIMDDSKVDAAESPENIKARIQALQNQLAEAEAKVAPLPVMKPTVEADAKLAARAIAPKKAAAPAMGKPATAENEPELA